MNKMEEITDKMAGDICGGICRYNDGRLNQEQLDAVCYGCELADHVVSILNEYERVVRVKRQNIPLWGARMMDRFMYVN